MFRACIWATALASKNWGQAVSQYQSALNIPAQQCLDPQQSGLGCRAGQISQGDRIRREANQLAPDQPAFMDTLAMLLAERGEQRKAIDLLRKALLKVSAGFGHPVQPGKSTDCCGQKDEARTELDALAKLGDKFPAQAEVSQLLKSLQTRLSQLLPL